MLGRWRLLMELGIVAMPEMNMSSITSSSENYSLELYSTATKTKRKTPWLESASELYRPSDQRLLAKLVTTFADGGCHMVSVTDPYGLILAFL
jgi:hypothetical protein